MERKIELCDIGGLGGIPGFRVEGHKYCCLASNLDIELDGVTYHLASEYAKQGDMGAVIDTIEMERNRRKPA